MDEIKITHFYINLNMFLASISNYSILLSVQQYRLRLRDCNIRDQKSNVEVAFLSDVHVFGTLKRKGWPIYSIYYFQTKYKLACAIPRLAGCSFPHVLRN